MENAKTQDSEEEKDRSPPFPVLESIVQFLSHNYYFFVWWLVPLSACFGLILTICISTNCLIGKLIGDLIGVSEKEEQKKELLVKIQTEDIHILSWNLEGCFTESSDFAPRNYFTRQNKAAKFLSTLPAIPDFLALPEVLLFYNSSFDVRSLFEPFGIKYWSEETCGTEFWRNTFVGKNGSHKYDSLMFNSIFKFIATVGTLVNLILLKPFINFWAIFVYDFYPLHIFNAMALWCGPASTATLGTRWKGVKKKLTNLGYSHYVITELFSINGKKIVFGSFHLFPSDVAENLSGQSRSLKLIVEEAYQYYPEADGFIFAGDFNLRPDTDMYNFAIEFGFKSAIKEFYGSEQATAFDLANYKYDLQTLDYIFYKGECIELKNALVGPVGISDHACLFSSFSIKS